MDVKKVLVVSQEIEPYIAPNAVSTFSRELSQTVQESGVEVRAFMPRYGAVNERRNQLHEVIRLSGLNIDIDDVDYPLIIKVATLAPTRLQVYFIDNDEFFSRHNAQGILETDSDPELNDERAMFFVRGVAETVKKLRWEPAVIHSIGWLTGLVPLYVKKIYNEDPAFRNAKVVYSLAADPKVDSALNPRMVERLEADGIAPECLEAIRNTTHRELHKLAIDFADAIAVSTEGVDPELIAYARATGKPMLESADVKKYYEFYHEL